MKKNVIYATCFSTCDLLNNRNLKVWASFSQESSVLCFHESKDHDKRSGSFWSIAFRFKKPQSVLMKGTRLMYKRHAIGRKG